ncbi:Protein YicC [hydrothermal vent metagenome]|uniref:Protein YicC n=1 Tax=hydrothermal vent metagenome TaxID=652676 RepID=A0A3B0TC90_9ZZZZ
MGLSSMTGFGAASGSDEGVEWNWELRCLNGRGLDLRLRVPGGYEDIEPVARRRLAARLARGSCQATLQIKRTETIAEPRLNEGVLAGVLDIARRLQNEKDIAPASAHGLLSIRGVLEFVEPQMDDACRKAVVQAMAGGLDQALDALVADRTLEGGKLAEFLTAQVDEMARLTGVIGELPARDLAAHLDRLRGQVDQLLGSRGEFTTDRLHQEAAILATKADISEELDRLAAHIETARALLASGEPVGRRLDFLSQEFNREANTICSKSGDIGTTTLGLELKAVIDQFKEQVQNIE